MPSASVTVPDASLVKVIVAASVGIGFGSLTVTDANGSRTVPGGTGGHGWVPAISGGPGVGGQMIRRLVVKSLVVRLDVVSVTSNSNPGLKVCPGANLTV